MAHELALTDGKPAMMFVHEVPWHGLGHKFEHPPRSSREVIKAAGLDWRVDLKSVFAIEGDKYCELPDYKVTVRSDLWGKKECAPFGLVGNKYTPVQNSEMLEFFEPLIAAGGFTYETAGALGQGERVWALAKVKGDLKIKHSDEVQRYLLFSNGHDGRTALQVRFTPVRVVCANTLGAALARGRDLLRSYHRPSVFKRIGEAQRTVDEIMEQYELLRTQFEGLANVKIDDKVLCEYMETVFPLPRRRANQTERTFQSAVRKVEHTRELARQLATMGRGNESPTVKDTLWTAYNGVVELVDHATRYRNPEHRFESILFGNGEATKQQAFETAILLAHN